MGFFADVGPLSVFVSHQVHTPFNACRIHSCNDVWLAVKLIHPDMRFDPNSNPPSFASDEQARILLHIRTLVLIASQIIEKNTKVRLKIVGTRVDATEIVCVPIALLLLTMLIYLSVRNRHYQRRPSWGHWLTSIHGFSAFSVKINSQRENPSISRGVRVRRVVLSVIMQFCIIKDEPWADAMQYIHVILYVAYIIRATYVSLWNLSIEASVACNTGSAATTNRRCTLNVVIANATPRCVLPCSIELGAIEKRSLKWDQNSHKACGQCTISST